MTEKLNKIRMRLHEKAIRRVHSKQLSLPQLSAVSSNTFNMYSDYIGVKLIQSMTLYINDEVAGRWEEQNGELVRMC
jgi:hypothetical protein